MDIIKNHPIQSFWNNSAKLRNVKGIQLYSSIFIYIYIFVCKNDCILQLSNGTWGDSVDRFLLTATTNLARFVGLTDSENVYSMISVMQYHEISTLMLALIVD